MQRSEPLPKNAEFYGYDPDGPNPFEESDNDVVVHPVDIENGAEMQSEFFRVIDPLAIDIYEQVLHELQAMIMIDET